MRRTVNGSMIVQYIINGRKTFVISNAESVEELDALVDEWYNNSDSVKEYLCRTDRLFCTLYKDGGNNVRA